MSFLRRQHAMLEWALASHRKRPGKTAALAGVLVTIVFLLGSFAFLRESVRFETAAVLRDVPDLVVQRRVAGRQDVLPRAALDAVRSVPGVANVQARLWGYYYDALAGANYTVAVPASAPPADGEAAIGSAIARARPRRDRSRLAVRSYRGDVLLFAVRTVLPEEADLVAGDLLIVSEADFRRLFDLPADAVSDLVVHLAPRADREAVVRNVRTVLPGAHVVRRQEMLASAASFLDPLRGLAAVLMLSMTLALVIVAFDKPLAAGAEEQQEIGILRAVGWSRNEALAAKAWESLTVSVPALLLGLLAAYAHVYVYEAALFAPVLRGWGVAAPALRPVPRFELAFLTAIAVSVTLLPACGTLIAARGAASGEPDAVIRA